MSDATAGTGQRVAERHRSANRSALRDALILLLILAAAAQGVLAQAHVHFRFPPSTSASAALGYASASPADGGAPGERASDLSSCALCQALAAGAAPLGSAVSYASPLTAFRYVAPSDSTEPEFVGAVSHIWTSRGPPLI
jgi:hypothetical protein